MTTLLVRVVSDEIPETALPLLLRPLRPNHMYPERPDMPR
jgi:hypothetical protein